MPYWLSELGALVGNAHSVSSTHIHTTIICDSRPRGSWGPLISLELLHAKYELK